MLVKILQSKNDIISEAEIQDAAPVVNSDASASVPQFMTPKKKRKMSCSTCGHFKSYGEYRLLHVGKNQKCEVPESKRREAFHKGRRCGVNGCKKNTLHHHDCDMPCCREE
jgi:hypothetical protein